LSKFDTPIAKLARKARTALRRRMPTAFELVYDNYNALAIGFCSTERASDCIVSVAVFPKNVALSFYYGAALPDPDGLLQGSGKQNRYIRVVDGDTARRPEVLALIDRGNCPRPDAAPRFRTWSNDHQVSFGQAAPAPGKAARW
jgi:hypothetical protein